VAESVRQGVGCLATQRRSRIAALLGRYEREGGEPAIGEALAFGHESIDDVERGVHLIEVPSAANHQRDPEEVGKHVAVPGMFGHGPESH
jgi:hypothetical protein